MIEGCKSAGVQRSQFQLVFVDLLVCQLTVGLYDMVKKMIFT